MAQSVSICVPAAGKCINNCKTCCSKMHEADYENRFYSSLCDHVQYIEDMRQRLEYCREKGCGVAILTGSTEPQQDLNFLKEFYLINRSLKSPFRDIEMQTTGAFVDKDMLGFLRSLGVQTIGVSTFCINNDEINKDITRTSDKNLNLVELCKNIKEAGINIRLCLNMTDHILDVSKVEDGKITPDKIFDICAELGANQVTFRKMWAPDDTSEQGAFIRDNCKHASEYIDQINKVIATEGTYLNTLEYGAKRYAYRGFSTVIDIDPQSTEVNEEIKYYVIRQNGKMYSDWNSPASLVF